MIAQGILSVTDPDGHAIAFFARTMRAKFASAAIFPPFRRAARGCPFRLSTYAREHRLCPKKSVHIATFERLRSPRFNRTRTDRRAERTSLMSPPPDALSGAVPIAQHEVAGSTGMPPIGRLHAVPVSNITPVSGRPTETLYRGFEILAAGLALAAALPLMLVVAALIVWDSPGPALFFHKRPGRSIKALGDELRGRTELLAPPAGYDPDRLYFVSSYFYLPKFRTMYVDARARFPEYYAYQFKPEEFHHQYPTHRHDPRLTRVGRVLRKLSIDELPNLWCVLTGQIRLVGPRPEAPEVLQYYTPEEMYKFALKPGITGLAQINGRGLLNWGETLAWDLQYVRTRSVWLDLKIIAITLKHVITRHGAF